MTSVLVYIILVDLGTAKVFPIGFQFPVLMSFNYFFCHQTHARKTSDLLGNPHQKLSGRVQVVEHGPTFGNFVVQIENSSFVKKRIDDFAICGACEGRER